MAEACACLQRKWIGQSGFRITINSSRRHVLLSAICSLRQKPSMVSCTGPKQTFGCPKRALPQEGRQDATSRCTSLAALIFLQDFSADKSGPRRKCPCFAPALSFSLRPSGVSSRPEPVLSAAEGRLKALPGALCDLSESSLTTAASQTAKPEAAGWQTAALRPAPWPLHRSCSAAGSDGSPCRACLESLPV